jgi:hypothetical protein
MKKRRNNPCPCGSGLKHKKCCLKKNNHNNKGKKKMNNKVIKPFITRGSIVGTNGERKVVMNKDGLSPSQLDFVYGCEKVHTKQIQKEERELENLLIYCMWVDKDDFFSSLGVCKEGFDLDETYQELVDIFNSNIPQTKVGDFIPLNKTSQSIIPLLEPYQHKENNKFYKMVFNGLNDGGTTSNLEGDYTLVKDESRNGWVVG